MIKFLNNFLLIFLFLVTSNFIFAVEKSANFESSNVKKIIKRINNVIENEFPDYRLLSKQDLNVDILNMHYTNYGANSLPWLCFGYFNFDTFEDIAVIVINTFSKSRKIIVFHGKEGSSLGKVFNHSKKSYSAKMFDDIYIGDDYTLQIGSESSVLSLKGTISNKEIDNSYYVYPLYDYITIIKWNSSKSILFLKNKTYRRVWISS